MLHNAMESLLGIRHLVIPAGVESHVRSVYENGKAAKMMRAVKPRRVEAPKVKGNLIWVINVQEVPCNSMNNWASAIMFQGILSFPATVE